MPLKKTTLLFEENVYKKLKEKSKLENISMGELVREAVIEYYGIKNKEEKMKALKNLIDLKLPVSDYEDMEKEIIAGATIDKEN